MTRAEIEGVAKGLSGAQRKLILAGSRSRFKKARTLMRHAKIGRRWPSRPNYREFSFLWEGGTPKRWGVINTYRLTSDGIAVRDFLREGGDGTERT